MPIRFEVPDGRFAVIREQVKNYKTPPDAIELPVELWFIQGRNKLLVDSPRIWISAAIKKFGITDLYARVVWGALSGLLKQCAGCLPVALLLQLPGSRHGIIGREGSGRGPKENKQCNKRFHPPPVLGYLI